MNRQRARSKCFQELYVWQKAHELVLQVYRLTTLFPASEKYGLTSQIQRATVSIAANIVEGYRRNGKRDKIRFFNYAQASLEETRYYLILINDLDLADPEEVTSLLIETSKLLNLYANSISPQNTPAPTSLLL